MYLTTCVNAKADVLGALDYSDAAKAKSYLVHSKEVILWNACSSNDIKEFIKIDTILIDTNELYPLRIMGRGRFSESNIYPIDLAYTYVEVNGKSECFAKVLGLNPPPGIDLCSVVSKWEFPEDTDKYWLPRRPDQYIQKVVIEGGEYNVTIKGNHVIEIDNAIKENVFIGKHVTDDNVVIDPVTLQEYHSYIYSDSTNANGILNMHLRSFIESLFTIDLFKKWYVPQKRNLNIYFIKNNRIYHAVNGYFSMTNSTGDGIAETSTFSPDFELKMNLYISLIPHYNSQPSTSELFSYKPNGVLKIDYLEFKGSDNNGVEESYYLKDLCIKFQD